MFKSFCQRHAHDHNSVCPAKMLHFICVQPKCYTLFVCSQNVTLYLCPAKCYTLFVSSQMLHFICVQPNVTLYLCKAKMLHFICVQPKCYTLFVSSQKVKHDLSPVTPVRLHPELMHMVLKDFMSTGKI